MPRYLADRLIEARHARFVGRDGELSVFESALGAEILPFYILHVFGPGGVGKTTLLQEFALLSEQYGARPVYLDAAYKWTNDENKAFPYRGQGIQVPTLDEVFQKFPQMRYVIEIKLTENPIHKPLCELIRQYNMQDKVMITSFHDEAIQNFREACPEVAISASRTEVRNFVLLGKAFLSGLIAPKSQSIQPPYDPKESLNIPIMTERFVREAHAKNIKVEPWTVNDPELMKQYIEWGVDGIITDRPNLMIEVLKEMEN